MLGALLALLKACLNFDFIGTSFEDSDDDFGTIHVPTQWKDSEYFYVIIVVSYGHGVASIIFYISYLLEQLALIQIELYLQYIIKLYFLICFDLF